MNVPRLQPVIKSGQEKIISSPVSDRVVELNTEVQESLTRLNTLIDNRSAWADGIEGCRESVVLLGRTQTRIKEILDAARQVESALASARAELERWSKMHAELATVERDLRAECDRYRQASAELSDAERSLRADCDKKQAVLDKQASSLANARALAQELIREVAP